MAGTKIILMRPNKLGKWRWIVAVVMTTTVIGVVWLAWGALPVISGYSAKMACSCVYGAGRSLESVQAEELGSFPLQVATVRLVEQDSTVEASVFGLASKKAVYRRGLGCTLLNGMSYETLRSQSFQLATPPAIDPDTIPWPMGDLLPPHPPTGLDDVQLEKAINTAFQEKDPGNPVRTRAVVVVYDGMLVGEKYAPGYSRKSLFYSWSMVKSVWGALAGILVGNGNLQLEAPAPVPEWRAANDGREKITLEHILQHTTGLDVEENYSKATTVTNMLFREADMGAYAAAQPLRDLPGTRFYYCSANSNILSRLIRHQLGDSAYHSFPARQLFYPLGMYSAILEPDASGTFVGSSYMLATARDYARFGQLYLNGGTWMGQEVLPAGWVSRTLEPAKAAKLGEYGLHMRLNRGAPHDSSRRKFPDLPGDLFYAYGYEGEYIIVIPSKKLVMVRLGQTPGDGFDPQLLVKGILASLP